MSYPDPVAIQEYLSQQPKLDKLTRLYWLVASLDRKRITVNESEQTLRERLVRHIDDMPGRLSEAVITESRSWR